MSKRQAERRKYHFIYKTTCSVNGKFYYGMHSTDDLSDGYLGSGTMLWHSIKKHGRENFSMEILEHLDSREALKLRERELINENMLLDPQCMNLRLGGEGGWDQQNSNTEVQKKKNLKAQEKLKLLKDDVEWSKRKSERISSSLLQQWASDRQMSDAFRLSFLGKTHTDETRAKIGAANSVHQSGSSNSQYGACWLFSEVEKRSIKIKREDASSYLNSGWKLGRKMF